MENQASSKNIMLNYGVYLGIISILVNVVLYATDSLIENSWIGGIVSFLAMIVILVLGIKKFKFDNNNILSFGQAVKVGVGIAIVSAVIGIVYNLIFLNFIEPDFQNQMLEVQKQAWEEANMTSEQIESAAEMTKRFSNPAITSAISIVAAAFFGFIISAIAGAIMKRTEEDGY